MYGLATSLLFMLYTSFVLSFTDIPANMTDTVMKLYGGCFEIFLHMTMFLHGSRNVTEIASEMLTPASFCLNKYAHLCQQGTFAGYIPSQEGSASSFQGDITNESVMNWRDFAAGSLTYQEAYCMISVIAIMMEHSQVNLCSVLSICNAALNSTQCEVIYTRILMALQENCLSSSQDYERNLVCSYSNACIGSTVAAVLCSIVALLAGGKYVHLKYFKKLHQSCKCGQQPQSHCSPLLSAPPENIPVQQQICTLSGSQHNRRILSSVNGDIHHVVKHHNFKDEFRRASVELTRFLNHHQEYKCPEVPAESAYETCNCRESVSEQKNQNIMEYMETSQSESPEYLEILPDLPDYNDLEIAADCANQQQVGFDDLEPEYVMVGEIVRSVQLERQPELSEKEMRIVNEKFQIPRQQITSKNVIAEDTNLEESDKVDKSSSFEGLPFMQELQDGEHIQNMGSRLSSNDELAEIVIENGNQLFSENSASLASEMLSLETPRELFSNAPRFRH